MRNKALFIDRDGTLIQMVYDLETGYIHTAAKPEDVKAMYGVFDLLKEAKRMGFKLILVSNQPNIALLRMTQEHFVKTQKAMQQMFANEGITFDGEYYCFHHPHAELSSFKLECSCRKPMPGLFLQAAKEHDIDLSHSWMMGDSAVDVVAGKKAGCRTILLANVHEASYLHILEEHLQGYKPDFIIKKIPEAIPILHKELL